MNADVIPDLSGKTVLITGATGGIGLEAAIVLAHAGARTVITGRNPTRIDTALDTIRKRSGSNDVEGLCADFRSQAAVRKLAADFCAHHDLLDVLVNNAGSVNPRRTLTADGIEATFAVNHLAPFLLTNLLLDTIVGSAPARIVNVASTAHYDATLDFADLGFERGYRIMRAYARSKLANVLFTRALARRLANLKVTVNAVHPGTVGTGIWNHGAPPWAMRAFAIGFAPFKRAFMLTPAQGAQTIVYLAISPEVEDKSGLYFEKNKLKQPSSLALDDGLAEKLWSESVRLTHFEIN